MITHEKRYHITDEQVAFYQENGYLHLPSVIASGEAAYLREKAQALIRGLAETRGGESAVQAQWGSAKLVSDLPPTLLHCHNAQFHSAAFTRLICDPA